MNTASLRIIGPLLGVLLLLSPPAGAWCVSNGSDQPVHVQALDASGFETDIPPGGQGCCDAQACQEHPFSTVLVVTGYVPLAQGRQPGWKGECRARVPREGAIAVSGQLRAIRCQVQ